MARRTAVVAEAVEGGEMAMSADEARHLTDRIKAHLWDAGRLIAEAYDRQAHYALGYANWCAYVESEYGITDREARYVLARERVRGRLESLLGSSGNAFPVLSVRQSQALGAAMPSIEERIQSGEDAQAVIAEYMPKEKPRGPRRAEAEPSADEEPETDRRQSADHRDEVSIDLTVYHSAPSTQDRQRDGLPYLREDVRTFWPARGIALDGVRSPRNPVDVIALANAIARAYMRLTLGVDGREPAKPMEGVTIPPGFRLIGQ